MVKSTPFTVFPFMGERCKVQKGSGYFSIFPPGICHALYKGRTGCGPTLDFYEATRAASISSTSFGTFGRFWTPKAFRFYSPAGKREPPVLCPGVFLWNSEDVLIFVDV